MFCYNDAVSLLPYDMDGNIKMKLRTPLIILVCLSVFLAACGTGETSVITTETPVILSTPTPDMCSAENLPGEAARVNKFMREFDDFSELASNTPQTQLVAVIPDMQRVLRDAEDQSVPACLENLKTVQILYMQIVVQTLMAFMGNSDAELVNSGISQARELHAKYDIELARLLGITLVVSPTQTSAPATPDANIAPTATP